MYGLRQSILKVIIMTTDTICAGLFLMTSHPNEYETESEVDLGMHLVSEKKILKSVYTAAEYFNDTVLLLF